MSSSIAPDVNRRRDRRRAGRVFLVGLGVTVVLTILSRGAARRREQALFDDRAAVQAQNIARELTTPLEAAYATATLFEASNEVTAAEFARFVDPQLARHPSIFAMAWIPRVREAERPAFEASLAAAHPGLGIRDPGPDGTFSPSPTRAVHFPVAFLEPPDPRLFGVDLAYDPARLAWVEPAIAHPDVYVTPRYDLVGEATTSGTVAAYAPVFADGARNGTEAERREKLRGVTAAIFRLERTVSQILERYPLDEMRLVLREEGTRGEEGILYSSTGEALGGSRAYGQHRLPVPVANRRWEIELESTEPLSSPLPYVVFVLGVLVSAFVTLAVWLWWRFRRLSHDVARLGQYVLTAKLGEGGMGSVYRAQHVLLRRPTAVKLIRPEYSDKPEAAERFEREVQAASELSHPNSIVVYDYGQTPDGILYYAMEYVEGITLQALVENDGPMPPGRVVAIVAQICGAVAEAHGRGIVHRDLKPSNVMLSVQGGVYDFAKVLDFGLVLVRGADYGPPVDDDAEMIGTPHYMAPEQMSDPSQVGPPADAYAIGCMLYFLLSGQEVFHRPTAYAICLAHRNDPPIPLSQRATQPLPPALVDLVMACLRKDPAARPDVVTIGEQLVSQVGVVPWTQKQAAAWWRAHGGTIGQRAQSAASTQVLDVRLAHRDTIPISIRR